MILKNAARFKTRKSLGVELLRARDITGFIVQYSGLAQMLLK